MSHIILPPAWRIPDRLATPELVYLQAVTRRSYLKLVSAGVLVATGSLLGCSMPVSEEEFSKNPKNFELSNVDRQVYPAAQNPDF